MTDDLGDIDCNGLNAVRCIVRLAYFLLCHAGNRLARGQKLVPKESSVCIDISAGDRHDETIDTHSEAVASVES